MNSSNQMQNYPTKVKLYRRRWFYTLTLIAIIFIALFSAILLYQNREDEKLLKVIEVITNCLTGIAGLVIAWTIHKYNKQQRISEQERLEQQQQIENNREFQQREIQQKRQDSEYALHQLQTVRDYLYWQAP